MKKTKKIIYVLVCCFILVGLESCGNARWATNAGVNVTWGPNGPKVRPHIDFDIYNGGRLNN